MKIILLCLSMNLLLFGADSKSSYLYPTHRQKEKGGDYQAKNFSYLLGKMKGFSEALLNMHFKLYEGYVKNTNSLMEMIQDMDNNGKDTTIAYGALKRRLNWEYDGMMLHDYYFSNLGGSGALGHKKQIAQVITDVFGGFERFKATFKATGLIRGIGWVVLAKGKEGHYFINWIDEHNIGELCGAVPLLVMDVWEHAYITEYGLDRAAYIDAFFANIDWDVVEGRLVH